MALAKDVIEQIQKQLDSAGINNYVVAFSDPDSEQWYSSYKNCVWTAGACELLKNECVVINNRHLPPS